MIKKDTAKYMTFEEGWKQWNKRKRTEVAVSAFILGYVIGFVVSLILTYLLD